MQIPGNIWIEAWQTTKPVPVRKQKRLFDDTKEAEKVNRVSIAGDGKLRHNLHSSL